MDQQNNEFSPIDFEAEQNQTTKPASPAPKKKKKNAVTTWLLGIVIVLAIAALAALCVNIFAPELFDRVFNSTALTRGDDVIMTVGDYEISTLEFNHYVYPLRLSYEASDPDYWKTHLEEGDYIKNQAVELFRDNSAMLQWAKDAGVELTAEEHAEVAQMIANIKANYATEADFYAELENNYLTVELYTKIYEESLIYEKLYNYVYEKSDLRTVSEADIAAYAEAHSYYGAKHILFLTTGDAAADAAKLALAEEVLAKLQAGADFDALMTQYTEDPGITSYPNGYTFTNGEMIAEFEEAVKSMEIGEISDLVQTTHGYHIILRIAPDNAQMTDEIISERASAKIEEYREAMPVKLSRGFDKITLNQTFWNYSSTQETDDAA